MSEDIPPYGYSTEDVQLSRARLLTASEAVFKTLAKLPEIEGMSQFQMLFVMEFALGIMYEAAGAVLNVQHSVERAFPRTALGYRMAMEAKLREACETVEAATRKVTKQ